jgi:hypothetical protein
LEGVSHMDERLRVGDRWQCASAHNIDVVPHMETHLVSEDGTFRSANYRTGRVSA